MIKTLSIVGFLTIFTILSTMGCGQGLPFEYHYTSANTVQIKYLGKVYKLNRYGSKIDTPFEYQFEPDGDIDITIEGKTYDIDSPYDIDKKNKKSTDKSKAQKKKKTTDKKTKKTTANKTTKKKK